MVFKIMEEELKRKIDDLSTSLIIITERQLQFDNSAKEMREVHRIQINELKIQLEESTRGWREAIDKSNNLRQADIIQLTTAFHDSLEKITEKFSEQSKNFVLQAEFGTVRYIVMTLGLGFVVQAIAKYLLKW